LLFGVLVTG